ncbi:hypothetical protein [Polyangium aurulentum]|uniref:hypothetical protein n=1 Tax=Polyangium aurulentum TaxID=2567896 RepID=UPI0010ADB616|nr:hypothetical protein [Polyangium aurulentum]UQA54855.1 hypothetical protein E8A73_026185 [Polyangium aurulentum]
MSLRPSFAKLLGPSALLLLSAATGLGYLGCSDSDAAVTCDENGENCVVCDGYGCHPANPHIGAGGGGQGGTGGQGGQGGSEIPCNPEVATCGCDLDSDCPSGTYCIDDLCLVGCNHSYECGAGEICANGQCLPGCDAQTPCTTGYTCEKGVCVPDPSNPACSDQVPCPTAGEICVNGLCTTGCTTHADCPSGQLCDSTTHSCIEDTSPTPACDASKTCPGTAQCGPDGYCHYPCSNLQQCKLIDTRFTACDQGVCKTDEEVKPECSLDKPCPAGKDCISNKCL